MKTIKNKKLFIAITLLLANIIYKNNYGMQEQKPKILKKIKTQDNLQDYLKKANIFEKYNQNPTLHTINEENKIDEKNKKPKNIK